MSMVPAEANLRGLPAGQGHHRTWRGFESRSVLAALRPSPHFGAWRSGGGGVSVGDCSVGVAGDDVDLRQQVSQGAGRV